MPSEMVQSLRARAERARTRLGFKADWYLTVLGAVIGVATALGAVAFAWALESVEHWSSGTREAWPLWTMPLIPMGGALFTGVIVTLFASEARGHGVPQVLHALVKKSGHIPTRIGLVKVLASISTVGTGGSAGAEGPIIQIGSTTGSAIGRRVGASKEHMGTLVACGAAAGVAAIFNAPIAGVFFALEILLRDFSMRTFTPIVIAAVFATAVAQVAHGENEAIFAADLFQRAYVFTPQELPGYLVLGLVCAVVAVGFTHLLHVMEDVFAGLKMPVWLKPVLGAALLGGLGIAFVGFTGSGGESPPFFGNGYPLIRDMLDPGRYVGAETGPLLVLISLLLVFKAAATVLTLGSGGSGGVFAPSLFIGATTGGAFGLALESMGLLSGASSPASYALVGMAAVVAGTTFAPLTAILLLFELTREPKVLAPIMLAAIVSTMLARRMMPESIYTARLRQRGIRVGASRDHSLLRRVPVMSVTITPLPHEPVYASDPLAKLITLHATHHVPDFVVVDQDGGYMGMVTGSDMRTALIDREAIPLLLVAELVRGDLPTITSDESLDSVLDKFAAHDVASLCLVHDHEPDRPMGLITRREVMARYQRALEDS